MDYSLLLGIHERSREKEQGVNRAGVVLARTNSNLPEDASNDMNTNRLTDASLPGLKSGGQTDLDFQYSDPIIHSRTMGSSSAGKWKKEAVSLDSDSHVKDEESSHPSGDDVDSGGSDYGLSSDAESDYYEDDSSDDETGASEGDVGYVISDEADLRTEPPLFNAYHGGICGMDKYGNKNDDIYFVGVIDILQQYNILKRGENFFKGFRHERATISAVPPPSYASRFVKFVSAHTE